MCSLIAFPEHLQTGFVRIISLTLHFLHYRTADRHTAVCRLPTAAGRMPSREHKQLRPALFRHHFFVSTRLWPPPYVSDLPASPTGYKLRPRSDLRRRHAHISIKAVITDYIHTHRYCSVAGTETFMNFFVMPRRKLRLERFLSNRVSQPNAQRRLRFQYQASDPPGIRAPAISESS